MKLKLLPLLFLVALCAGCGSGINPTPRKANAPSKGAAAHVILIVEENHGYSTVVYQNRMPWLKALGDKYGVATNYYSDEKGSLLDYLWLSSEGNESRFGCNGNQCTDPITDDNIFREINKAGM